MSDKLRSSRIPWLLLAVWMVAACRGSGTNVSRPNTALPPIALTRGTGDVYLLYSNGKSHYVIAGGGVSWAPGHQELLVQRTAHSSPPSSEIWLVSTDGAPLVQVTSVYPDQVRFFAAGKYRSTPFLAYDTEKNGIQLCDLLGGEKHVIPVKAPVDSLAISPDGARIAFTADSNQDVIPITLYVTGTYKKTPLNAVLPASKYRTISGPSWSPDGQWIAATITAIKGSTDLVTSVWLMHPDGTALHKLTEGVDSGWSPDGQWLSYLGQEGNRRALFKIHPDGTGRTQLTPYADSSDASAIGQESW
jgi:Tol biopolymer transport system component